MQVYVLSESRVLAEFLRRPLSAAGHEAPSFDDPAALRRALAEAPPRAVFVPRRHRDADPLELVAELKADARTRGVAAIVYSPEEDDAEAAREVRADAFLRVPFSSSEILEVLGMTTRTAKLVVLADDSDLIHRHTVPILEAAGYEVVSARDGVEALALVRERRPDLVITDIEMPGPSGYEVCRTIKESPETGHIPVVICSALGEAADLERGFDAGADDYLTKPVVAEELVSRVRAIFAGIELGGRERILVVDDSPAVRHMVADSLARQGFDVVTAQDGQDGLERAQATKPEMVITDYDMPRMTGFELVHALKRDPATRDIPVMMLTARDSRRDQAQMRAAGLTSYLVKPFSVDKCIAMVERILAERRLSRYKEASRLYLAEGAVKAAENVATEGMTVARAEAKVAAVMFSDICGFTNMSSQMRPEEVVAMLNEFFDVMCPILKEYGAEIDKFIGDCIMAVFEERSDFDENAATRAVRAGLAMQVAMERFTEGHATPLKIRIGINTGPLVRGDIGSLFHRREYTVIGDTVNRANRYEANAPPGGVLVSASTVAAIGEGLEVEEKPGLKLKGVTEPVVAYVVKSIAPPKPREGDTA